jgi:hypothetical protein
MTNASTPTPPAPTPPPDPSPATVTVRATQAGVYDNGYRASGDEFLIREADFSPTWMEKVEKGEPTEQAEEPAE